MTIRYALVAITSLGLLFASSTQALGVQPATSPPSACAAVDLAENKPGEATVTVRFRVDGTLTEGCPGLIRAALSRVSGVRGVEAELVTGIVTVDYLPQETSPEVLRDVLKDTTGFDARVVP